MTALSTARDTVFRLERGLPYTLFLNWDTRTIYWKGLNVYRD